MADTFDSPVMFGGLLGQPDASADSGSNWGGLLGGPRDDLIAPIIGQQALKGARTNALLNLGAGLLANSGYSRMPVSTGQALAAGLQGAQQAYSGSLDSSLKGAQLAQQLRLSQFDFMRRKMLMDAAQGALARRGLAPGASGTGVTPAPSGGASAPVAGVPGMPPSSVGAIPTASTAGGALPPPGAAAASAAGGAGMFDRDTADAFTLMDPEHQAGYQAMYERDNPSMMIGPDGRPYNPRDPAILGQSFNAIPQGMVRMPNGSVRNAAGFLQSQYEQEVGKAAAEHSQDLVQVVVPGKGTMTVPRSALGVTMGVGPNGQPQLSLGNPGGFMSAEDPASQKEREGDVSTFLGAKKDAMDKAAAATEALPQLDNIDQLIHSVKPQYGDTARYEVGRVLDSLGMLKGDSSQWVTNAKQYQQAQRQQVLSSLKTLFPGRISNMEMNSAMASMGNIDDPMQAVLMANDIKRVAAARQQARSDFLQNYDGPRGKFEQSWQNSAEGKKSLYDYPQMWKHLPMMRGKEGTPAAGQTFVKTPNGNIYPAQANQFGEPVPVEAQ